VLLAEMTENVDVALLALNDFDEVVNYFQEASHAQCGKYYPLQHAGRLFP